MSCYQITVRGKVQGVFFRASTKSCALDLGVKGWVKNQSDGSVLIEAEGPKDKVEQLIKWCHEGSAHSKVADVEFKEVESKAHRTFEIVH